MGNSPDLNAIEPTWAYMKWKRCSKGVLANAKQAREQWTKTWDDMKQAQIQRWIERLPAHVAHIIALRGGNEYIEGRGLLSTTVKKCRMPIVAS
jgi:hypothetical protein